MASNTEHPLIRDGKSQTERLDLRALAPQTVKLDDRSERQLLVYLNEFAKSIAYYDTDETPERRLQQSNWQSFFRSGSSVQVSLIEAYDIVDYENRFDQTKQNFLVGLVRADYAPLFDFLFESALSINGWYVALSSDVVLLDNKVILNETPLRRRIRDLIESNLRPALEQLIAVANLFVKTQSDDGYHFPDLSDLMKNDTRFWQLTPSVRASRDSVLAALPQNSIEFQRLIRERLDDIFRTFAKVTRQIVEAAANQDIVQPTGTHEPHLTLLYTFLRLFQHVVNDFNQLPQKHLDFYFREVLGLKTKPLTPDAAHIVFELPKTTPQYKLDKNTLLEDGKDAKGADVRFALDNEIVVTTTQIAELRTLNNAGNFFLARPKANSFDGLGKPFPDPLVNQWDTFGSKNVAETKIKAEVGLAIASPILVLENGERTITLTLNLKEKIPTNLNIFNLRLSGKKTWFSPKGTVDFSKSSGNQLVIEFILAVGEDAVVVADPSVLGVDYAITGAAVLQLLVVQNGGTYNELRNKNITSVKIDVKVAKLQNVQVRTDEGDQDPTKPFMPFGAVPSVGSTFCIGSPEIFSKNLTKFDIAFDWDKLPVPPSFSDFSDYYSGYDIDNVAKPSNATLTASSSYVDSSKKEVILLKHFLFKTPLQFSNNFSFTFNNTTPLNGGNIKFKLDDSDFRHLVYPKLLTKHTLAAAKENGKVIVLQDLTDTKTLLDNSANNAVNDTSTMLPNCITVPPNSDARAISIRDKIKTAIDNQITNLKNKAPVVLNPPYTPIIKNLTIGYSAEAMDAALFHIHPFDEGKNFEKITPLDNAPKPLIINFLDQGALLIGMSDAIEDSLTPILFQLLESSSNTNLTKATIDWTYLDGNVWKPLETGKHILSDATNGFIQTGIIETILPTRINGASTVLPPQYYWLKASSKNDLGAVCQTIGVHTQAVRTTFQPSESNDTGRLSKPLAANAIAKLDVADSNIKTVIQPYDSFGGLPNEDNPHFYRRISERLRHKGRAVALFDYEQLVLEAFPEVFKVKCIPHTFSHIQSTGSEMIKDIHFAPSYVTVVVVPNAQLTRLVDPLRPTASRALLGRIESFLKARISPFVRLQVLNPIYENISTRCEVKFHEGRSPEYYREVLEKDLVQFLAPWAFDPTAQITFGGVIYLSSIVGFVERLAYVDFVSNMTMFKTRLDIKKNLVPNAIEASAARGILSSGSHVVTLFVPKEQKKVSRGIGFDWKIPK